MSQIRTLETQIGRKLAILDVDWSQIGTLHTLIGSRTVCEVRLKFSHDELIVKYEIMVLACQVGLFH